MKIRVIAQIAVVMVVAPALQTQAATTNYWQTAAGYWDVPANWDIGVPTSDDIAYVSSASPARTATITNGVAAVANELRIAYHTSNTRGAVEMTGGSLTVTRLLIGSSSSQGSFAISGGAVAFGDGRIGVYSIGTVTQTGGSVSGTYNIVGQIANGKGTYDQSGGTATFGPTALYIGSNAGALGNYKLSSNAVLNSNGSIIGNSGTGIFEQNGGTFNANSGGSAAVTLGSTSTGKGTLVLNKGSFNAADLYVGSAGWGSVTQHAGSAAVANMHMANGTGSGSYTLSGGTLSSNNENIGYKGVGAFEQYGGTNLSSGWLAVGVTNAIPFNTVTVETGTEYGELKSATVNYYEDRITLKVRVFMPQQGTVIGIL